MASKGIWIVHIQLQWKSYKTARKNPLFCAFRFRPSYRPEIHKYWKRSKHFTLRTESDISSRFSALCTTKLTWMLFQNHGHETKSMYWNTDFHALQILPLAERPKIMAATGINLLIRCFFQKTSQAWLAPYTHVKLQIGHISRRYTTFIILPAYQKCLYLLENRAILISGSISNSLACYCKL